VRFDDALLERARAHLAAFAFDRRAVALEGRKAAAVAVVLLPDLEGRGCFLLTKRTPTLRAHTGQWALPGGRMDTGESPETAALRELDEELGLKLGADKLLGLLDDYPTRSGYVITPVVFWANDPGALSPNPAEVARVHLVPLEDLDAPDAPRFISIPESDRPVIQFPLLGGLIHAPTAAVIYQIREVVSHGRPTRVDHFEQPVWAWR
jgi:8-oxo-dGTP pyrophosphatase MutT (NUDIX family)